MEPSSALPGRRSAEFNNWANAASKEEMSP